MALSVLVVIELFDTTINHLNPVNERAEEDTAWTTNFKFKFEHKSYNLPKRHLECRLRKNYTIIGTPAYYSHNTVIIITKVTVDFEILWIQIS